MDSNNDFQRLVLKGLDCKELERRAYGRCVPPKRSTPIWVEEVGEAEMQRTAESFMRECSQCSTLRHPNVIQFLGVYYPSTAGVGGVQGRMQLPVMVMEMRFTEL